MERLLVVVVLLCCGCAVKQPNTRDYATTDDVAVVNSRISTEMADMQQQYRILQVQVSALTERVTQLEKSEGLR